MVELSPASILLTPCRYSQRFNCCLTALLRFSCSHLICSVLCSAAFPNSMALASVSADSDNNSLLRLASWIPCTILVLIRLSLVSTKSQSTFIFHKSRTNSSKDSDYLCIRQINTVLKRLFTDDITDVRCSV